MYEREGAFFSYLKLWMAYVGGYDRFMFGTDWPLVNLPVYIRFIQGLVQRAHWDEVFFKNANRIYQLGL